MENTDQPIEYLVERCKQGDTKAQYQIYSQYAKAMFSLCFRLLNHYQDAEDVLQEAFVKAFARLDSFRYQASFGAWLKKIVVNTALNTLQKKKMLYQEIQATHENYSQDQDDTDEISTVHQVEHIRQAIQQLPDGFRVVFSLYLLEGYDHEEISQILGISVSTSKSQYFRAKKKLLEILKN